MKILTLLCALALALTGFEAFATVVRSMNLTELVDDAEYIVKAEILAKDTVIDAEESGYIVTYWTLKVTDWLKGNPTTDNELVIKQIGQGVYTLDGNQIRQNLFFPEYEIGKTYVLFLPEAHSRTGMLAPVGLQQGVFEVITQNAQETIPQLQARQNMLQARISNNAKNRFLLFELGTATEDTSYSNFKSMIKSAGE